MPFVFLRLRREVVEAVIHIVEDDRAMLDSLLLLVKSAGFDARGYTTAEEYLADEKKPISPCLLVDLRLPGMNGVALHKHLTAIGADPLTIIITGHGDLAVAVSALKAGAMDFVSKPFDPAALLESIREATRRADVSRTRRLKAEENQARLRQLTPREATILEGIVDGQSSKLIAAQLGISVRTVEHHRAHIMEKVGARTLSQLIKTALGIAQSS